MAAAGRKHLVLGPARGGPPAAAAATAARAGRPGPFAFADANRVRAILAAAGWQHVAVERRDVPMPIAGPGQLAEATDFATRVGALARILDGEDADFRSRVRQVVADALATHDGPGGITLGGSIWLVSARV